MILRKGVIIVNPTHKSAKVCIAGDTKIPTVRRIARVRCRQRVGSMRRGGPDRQPNRQKNTEHRSRNHDV